MNEFVPFAYAIPGTAYTLTPGAYAALTTFRQNGFQPGIVAGDRFNTVMRQASTAAAGTARFAEEHGSANMLDNGDPQAFADGLKAGVDALVGGDPTIFTPTIEFGGASVGMTYSFQRGRFTRRGRQIDFWFFILLSNKGSSTGPATFKMAGLPNVEYNTPAITEANAMVIPSPGIFYAFLFGGFDGGLIRYFDPATGALAGATDAHFTNISSLYITGSYLTP